MFIYENLQNPEDAAILGRLANRYNDMAAEIEEYEQDDDLKGILKKQFIRECKEAQNRAFNAIKAFGYEPIVRYGEIYAFQNNL